MRIKKERDPSDYQKQSKHAERERETDHEASFQTSTLAEDSHIAGSEDTFSQDHGPRFFEGMGVVNTSLSPHTKFEESSLPEASDQTVRFLRAIAAAEEATKMKLLELERREAQGHTAIGLEKSRLFLPEKVRRKYTIDSVVRYSFEDLSAFEGLRKKYHQCQGEPGFITLLCELSASSMREELLMRPELYAWNKKGDFVIVPTPSYSHHLQQMLHPKRAKRNPDGFGLGGWFIHPKTLRQGGVFSKAELRTNPGAIRAHILQGLKQEDLRFGDPSTQAFFQRSAKKDGKLPLRKSLTSLAQNNPSRIDDIEKNSPAYLSTILDLNEGHIDWLEDIEKMTLQHLLDVYDVDPKKDQVRLYFHFPYAEKTATLHLHIRVNQATMPLEQAKSYPIRELIDCLKSGRSIPELILQRQREYGGLYANPGAEGFLQGVEGLQITRVKNPFGSNGS